MATVSDTCLDGYVVAYDREEIQFPVCVLAVVSAVLLVGAYTNENVILLVLSVIIGCIAYYNFPLLETGRPRLAANRYGLFIEGLGLLKWRAVERIDIISVVVRANSYQELEIALNQPVNNALAADGRVRPAHLRLMRLPWAWCSEKTIRIPLEVFDRPALEIYRTFLRLWLYYGSVDRELSAA
jgi:hypothetical protein